VEYWAVLAGLPPAERTQLLAAGRRRRFARGQVLFHEGDRADSLHLLAAGRVAVKVATPQGDTVILTVLGPGQVFGELALLASDPIRTASVTALEACETIALHRAQFDRLRATSPSVDRVLVAALSAQVARLSAHLLEVLFAPARARVLRRLLALAQEFDGGIVRLTQEDLALMAGTTRPTVNEILRDAEREGTVRLGRGRIEVLDVARLAKRAR
jgi:CRP-like cAMP-binding protein